MISVRIFNYTQKANLGEAQVGGLVIGAEVKVVDGTTAHLVVTSYTTSADNTKIEFQERYG